MTTSIRIKNVALSITTLGITTVGMTIFGTMTLNITTPLLK